MVDPDPSTPVVQRPRRRFRWRRMTGRAVVAYLLLVIGVTVACVAGCADTFVLFPSRTAIDGPDETRITAPSPSGPLEIWTRSIATELGPPPKAFILAFNGNGSRAEYEVDRITEMWSQHPVEIWAVNYPGYGGSAGAAKLVNIPPAALASYDALAKVAAGRPIFVQGHSLGTAAALYVAAHRAVAGLVLHNPPPLRQLIMGRFGWWNLWLAAGAVARAIPPEIDSRANGGHCAMPAVFIRAQEDTLVTPPYQKMVFDAYAGPKRLVSLPGAGHNDAVSGSYVPSTQAAIDWLWNQVIIPASPTARQ